MSEEESRNWKIVEEFYVMVGNKRIDFDIKDVEGPIVFHCGKKYVVYPHGAGTLMSLIEDYADALKPIRSSTSH